MASIVFDFLARTVGLDKALKEENQKVGDFVKNVEKGTEKIDKSFDKMGKSAKDALKEQKQLIKEIEQDVKKLEKAVADATPGKGRKDMVNELRSAKKALAEEQEKLLGLQREQVELNNIEEESQNRVIGTLGKWALGLVTVTGAIKLFKGIMASTDETAIAFNSTIEGLKTSIDYLFKSVATGDFNSFFKGLKEAFSAGKEYSKEQNEIGNIRREYAIKEADLNKEIEEKRRIIYEDDKTATSDKIKAGDELLLKMKQKADMEIDLAIRTYNAVAKLEKDKNKMTEENIRYAIENYQEVQKVGKEYAFVRDIISEYYKEIKNGPSDPKTGGVYMDINYEKQTAGPSIGATQRLVNASQIADLKERLASMLEANKDASKLAEIYTQFARVSDKERQLITDSIVDIKQAENQYLVESKRVFKMKENMTDQEIAKEKEKVKAYNDVINAISALKEEGMGRDLQMLKGKYEDDLELYKDDEEMKVALKEKYELDKFEIEKKYLKKTIDEAKQAAEKLANIPSLSPYSITQRYLSGLSSSGVTQTGALPSGLMASHADTQTPQNIETELEKQIRLRQEILYLATSLTAQLAEQLGLEEDAIARLSELAGIIEGVASQNYAQAASSLVSFITENIKAYDTWEQVIDLEKLERLAELSEKAQEKGGAKDALQAEIDALNSAKKDAVWALEYAENKLQHANSINRQIREDNVAAAKETLKQIESQFEAAQKALDDVLTGGITRNTIADAVADGFTEGGKTGIDNIADYMSNVLRDAASQVFKQSILDDPAMQQYIDATKKALSDGILSPQEKAQFDKMAKEMGEKWGPAWESLMGSFDTMGQARGLTGAIKGVTEDTASELAGILRGVRDDVRASRAVDRAGLMHLAMIEANTKATADNTSETNKKLDVIITNTKPVLSGDL
jgi:uncharacterized cupredoxin-like copper-binding protein